MGKLRVSGMLVTALVGALSASPLLGGVTESKPRRPGPRRAIVEDPFDVISQTSLLGTLGVLTSIQPYSLWRNSASQGEAEAQSYLRSRLERMHHLRQLGLEVTLEPFHTYHATEVWESRLELATDGTLVEVEADGLQGQRDSLPLAMRMDTDGVLNDRASNPRVVDAPVLVVRSAGRLDNLSATEVRDHIVLLDYALIDRFYLGYDVAIDRAWRVLDMEPAGLVVVTKFSNQQGESHGSFIGDTSALVWVTAGPRVPILYARVEDLGMAGIRDMDDLDRVNRARLTLDADVFSPGDSANLMARIPGEDSTRCVILGAHIDSPNSPGALDDGSGSAVLAEVARAIDISRTRPPVDVYLVWFGSHERGLYGSSNFIMRHSELLDRALAMLQVDCLTRPVDGIEASLYVESWTYRRFGDGRLTWAGLVSQKSAARGVGTIPLEYLGLVSDNSSFNGMDVPNANLIYMNPVDMEEVHVDGHLHDPYDTLDLARQVSPVLEEMAHVALAAALDTPANGSDLRVSPAADRRALFVGSHTEHVHLGPAALTELGMALAWEGFDVDAVPFGTALRAADLIGVDLVIALPVSDYPSPDGDVGLYDEAWSTEEVEALTAWVEAGGTLVITTSAHRLKYSNLVYEDNEDWADAEALGAPFGIGFAEGVLEGNRATVSVFHPLTAGLTEMETANNNAVGVNYEQGQVLARLDRRPVAVAVDVESGRVLALGDVGMLGARNDPVNLQLWRNLAVWSR